MAKVVEWDGKHVPEALRTPPPGRYLVEPADEPLALSADEEQGIRQALASLDSAKGRSLAEVRERILKVLDG